MKYQVTYINGSVIKHEQYEYFSDVLKLVNVLMQCKLEYTIAYL
jgi:hypothetical protein